MFHVSSGALDEPLMTRTVKDIVAKKKVTVPNYDFVTHCRLQFIFLLIHHLLHSFVCQWNSVGCLSYN